MNIYQNILKPLLFKLQPETAHDLFLSLAGVIQKLGLNEYVAQRYQANLPLKSVEVSGIKFPNPIGLAAGFDKNCLAIPLLSAFGFGHIEIGSVTFQPQIGNPKPRIFRLPEDRALINRMGFPSAGAKIVADRLRRLRQVSSKLPIIGVNIGKTKLVELEQALSDYQSSFQEFQGLADYFVLNVSSPNTPELRKLQEKARLKELFEGINSINYSKTPLFVKIAPDLTWSEVDEILEVCTDAKINGIIATNTTLARDNLVTQINEIGGLSGEPLFSKSLSFINYISQKTSGNLPIIAVGGISNAEQARAMLDAGACLFQIYTSFIYQGPGVVKKLLS